MAYLNRILGVGRKAVFLIFLHVTCLVPHALLFGQNQDFLSRGNDAFLDQKYDVALLHYRQHLRSQPSDVKTWNLVAATYYHLGQPRRTLQILKRYRAQANPRSHNLFYQGLAYDAIVQTESAIRYLTEASQFKDPFAALATFELIAIYAASRDYKSALSWVEHFQQNFPDGPHHQVVADLKAQLQIQEAVNITQSQRHQYQMGLFQRHPWSLFSTPHFWYFQLGYYYAQGSRTNPAIDQQRRPTVDENAPFEDTALRVRASFGLGPYHNKETSYYLGYYYKQDWATTRDRLETYIKEPLDFNYLPFRPDLQLRTHRLLVDFQSYMRAKWSLGIYSHIEFVRAGSSLYPAPERPEIRKTLNVSYSTKFVPWITWQFKDAQGFQAYFPFEKTINQEQSDFSKQNYRLFDVSSPFFSYAFAYQGSFLNDQLKLRTDLFRFSYQHNDYWEDHTRTGLFTKARYRFIPHWSLFARIGIYTDDYEFKQIKTNTCGFQTQIGSIADRGINCSRVDSGQFFQGGLLYQPKPHYIWLASASYLNHENPELKVYNETRVEFLFSFSLAFPGIDDPTGILNRFTETSLEYEGF